VLGGVNRVLVSVKGEPYTISNWSASAHSRVVYRFSSCRPFMGGRRGVQGAVRGYVGVKRASIGSSVTEKGGIKVSRSACRAGPYRVLLYVATDRGHKDRVFRVKIG
jgi:hypothetical protein